MGRFPRSAAALAVACAFLTGPLACSSTGAPPGAKTSARTYTVTGHIASVVINGGAGKITVTGSDRASVQVTEQLHFSKTPPSVKHVLTGSALTLSYTCSVQLDCGVGYDVQVPRGVSVKALNRAGSIDLISLSGPVTARTIAGVINATGLGSRSADLRSNAGSVSAVFSAPPDSVSASTNAGAIKLIVPRSVAYQVSTHTFVGSTTVTVPQTAPSAHKITATSSLGSITIVPPS